MPLTHALNSTYDFRLVVISIAIAVLSAYTALTFAAQVTPTKGWQRLAWLVCGAVAMGTGIWSMHFVGMLAFCLPIPTHYDFPTVLLSLLAAILASGLALKTVSQITLSRWSWLNSSLWMGLGISAMHYIGMAALRVQAHVHYDFKLLGLSIATAIGVSMVALALVFRLRSDPSTLAKTASSILMGAAIPAMHYIGMAAVRFEAATIPGDNFTQNLDNAWMSSAISAITVVVLGLSLLVVLEVRVKERTASLVTTNQQLETTLSNLQQAQAHLIHSEKMSSLGEMVAGIAHEIKNPTTFISGNVEYLNEYTDSALELLKLCQQEKNLLPPKTKAYLQTLDADFIAEDYPKVVRSIETGIDRIREIVFSLRSFARMDQKEVAMQPTDLHQGIDSTLLILHHRLKISQIQVVKSYGEIPLVKCHAGQINQVFMNILANAIDALEEQEQHRTSEENKQSPSMIKITTSYRLETVTINILDNGQGMSQAVHDRLFEAFYTTKSQNKGTGLGLSISHKIITETHHGQLICNSAPNQGSEFLIQLPIHKS